MSRTLDVGEEGRPGTILGISRDEPIPEDEDIAKAHPAQTGRHDLYQEAMRFVSAKHSKKALVALVNWLLLKCEPVPPSGLLMRIVETDNYGGDYPDEKFVGPPMDETECRAVCEIMNRRQSDRFYTPVQLDYVLSPGFEP